MGVPFLMSWIATLRNRWDTRYSVRPQPHTTIVGSGLSADCEAIGIEDREASYSHNDGSGADHQRRSSEV